MNFDQILLRLKQQLGVTTDKEVAGALGLSKTAFAERKRRGVFPVEAVAVLAGRNSNIDVDYVLNGVSSRVAAELRDSILQVNEYAKAMLVAGGVSEQESAYEVSDGLAGRSARLKRNFESLDEQGKLAVETMINALLASRKEG